MERFGASSDASCLDGFGTERTQEVAANRQTDQQHYITITISDTGRSPRRKILG